MPMPDNEQVNIEFVIAVEEYPILYNYNLKNYSNRHEQDKVWKILAAEFQATESECKLRWRNIRSAFTRFLRSKWITGSVVRKPYYLWDHLQFLLPYTKSRTQPGNLGGVSGSSSSMLQATATDDDVDDPGLDQPVEETKTTIEKILPEDDYVPPQPPARNSTPSSSLFSWCSSKTESTTTDPLQNAVTNYLENEEKHQLTDPIAAADLNFLTSLLPDVTGLSPRKKRMFKRKVFDLLDELSEDGL